MKRIKKRFLSLLMLLMMIITAIPVYADSVKPAGNILKFQLNNKAYVVNGNIVNMDVAPTSLDGRTVIPIAYVANPLDADVQWEARTKKVTVTLRDTKLELWIGNNVAKVNGTNTFIDPTNANVKPVILSSRTMLPMRFVAENLGCSVEWEASTKQITISEKSKASSETKPKDEEKPETPPAETPPAETPPVETPPAETPPAETPPAETPPAETPPAETPLAETPPEKNKTTTPANPMDRLGVDSQYLENIKAIASNQEKIDSKNIPDWVKNNKTIKQNISYDNMKLVVVSHLGKGYDVVNANYGESNGLRQPVLNTDLLHKYNFMQESFIGESYQKSVVAESAQEYSKQISHVINADGHYLAFSGSVKTSFGNEHSKSKNRYYATYTVAKPSFDFYIAMPGNGAEQYQKYKYFLNETAKKEINDPNFPVSALIDKYGQYVLVGLVNGAKADFNVSVEKDKVFDKNDFALNVKAKAEFLIAGGSAEYQYSQSVSHSSFNSSAQQTVRTIGYGFSPSEQVLKSGGADRVRWEETAKNETSNMIDYSRILNNKSLIPLYELASDSTRKKAIENEVKNRLNNSPVNSLPKTSEEQYKNYLVGVRVGLANEGMNDAVKKAMGTKKEYGTEKFKEPVYWKLMPTSPFNEDTADLNEGATKKDRDYIALALGWLPKNKYTGTRPFPIRDLYIGQSNSNKGMKPDTHNGTGGYWHLIDKNLNYGAGNGSETALYLAYTVEGKKRPIVDMVLCVGNPKQMYPGWEVVKFKNTDRDANLNSGVNGTPIYLVIKREEAK